MTASPLGPDDLDHLPIGTLRDRIRSLTHDELAGLRDYERQHANRTPVLEIIDSRLKELREGAEPSPGTHSIQPERPGIPETGVPGKDPSPAPPRNPPPHGVPAQPTKPKGNRHG